MVSDTTLSLSLSPSLSLTLSLSLSLSLSPFLSLFPPGTEGCYITIMESDTMVEDATKAAMKKAKKAGVPGPYKPLILADLTEASSDIYSRIPRY
jgi:hypothetical protein